MSPNKFLPLTLLLGLVICGVLFWIDHLIGSLALSRIIMGIFIGGGLTFVWYMFAEPGKGVKNE